MKQQRAGSWPANSTICVFAAAKYPANPIYWRDASELGRLVGEQGFDLVYGGTPVGLMGRVAMSAHVHGARVIGVVPGIGQDPTLDPEGGPYSLNAVVIGTRSLEERKHKMLELSDAAIALVGGLGTFDEIATSMERGRSGRLTRGLGHLVVLNTAGFYDGLKQLLDCMAIEGMISSDPAVLPYFADTPQQAIDHIVSELNARQQ